MQPQQAGSETGGEPEKAGGNAKLLIGGGGCGCLLGLALFVLNVVLVAMAIEHRRNRELLPVGVAAGDIGTLLGAVGVGLIVWGIIRMKSTKS